MTRDQLEMPSGLEDDTTLPEQPRLISGMHVSVNLPGFGFSFIDQEPKELIFVCLNKVVIGYNCEVSMLSCEDEETKEETSFSIFNVQIDNLLDDNMPVLFGAKRYYDKHL